MPVDSSETRVAVVESRLDNHEKICGERYEEISKGFENVTGKLDKIMYVAFGTMFTVLAYVLANWAPWAKVPH